jgi:hypothetical protein
MTLTVPGAHCGNIPIDSDGIMQEVLGMAFVITESCMDVMDQACIRVCPVACIHCDAGKDRKLYIISNVVNLTWFVVSFAP